MSRASPRPWYILLGTPEEGVPMYVIATADEAGIRVSSLDADDSPEKISFYVEMLQLFSLKHVESAPKSYFLSGVLSFSSSRQRA